MSQAVTVMPTAGPLTMAAYSADVNAALAAIVSQNSGTTAPSATAPGFGQFWLDTSTTPRTLRIYDGAQWVAVGTLDTAGHLWATVGASGGLTGFRNRLINGAFAVDQRNAGAAQTIAAGAALAYTVDRLWAACTGASVTGQRIAGTMGTPYAYRFTGAASVTGIQIGERIEAINCWDLAGTSATLSVDLANSLLTTVTWTAYYATTTDTFGSLASPTKTLIATGSFTVNATVSRYTTNISIPSAATTGIEVVLSVGAQSSGTWTIGRIQLEPGATATSFEFRPIGTETELCQRYFQTSYEYGTVPGTATLTGSVTFRVPTIADAFAFVGFWTLTPQMRGSPTVISYSPNTGTAGKAYNNVNGDFNVQIIAGPIQSSKILGWQGANASGASSAGTVTQNYVHFTASAEL
ncbi:MAG: hypothetical protein P4L82_12235 [Ancalomicrobiaceae bacterium]|nr:hypothetical protein [Ancalomicrobiaceae bacterium]